MQIICFHVHVVHDCLWSFLLLLCESKFFDWRDCLTNGCVAHLAWWWVWSCLSAPASSLHCWLASCLQHHKKSTVHQSLPASTQPIHSKSYAVPSCGGRCYWVPWGPNTESAKANLYDPTVKQADEDEESPNACYGGGGHTATFLGANVYTQAHSGRRVMVDKAAGQYVYKPATPTGGNSCKAEDSLGVVSRGSLTTLDGHLSKRRKTFKQKPGHDRGPQKTCPREGKPKEKPGLRAAPDESCHQRRRIVAHAACATHKTDCSCTYNTMAMQLSLEQCCVVVLDHSWEGTAPGSQPQRSPTSATNCDWPLWFDTMDGQSRANG